ncbi:momilactone A synthase isoform X1 [Amborella trichopoda]|uniref:momilactone A synthase isoform X1 n=1 Tax=Amborella trichopoda TaxID=13333 RepID=UPI0009BEF3A4|nr:momilactone A synthase isoform X1 [Amborella trichopoda]|eukprot:XP_020529420.1 momilactone A synthase isoform X1 [Amborella trichopoda]
MASALPNAKRLSPPMAHGSYCAASSDKLKANNDWMRLEGKIALITGGASGIGAATARLFSQHGARVIIADIQDDLGQSTASSIPNATYTHCDVTNEEDICQAIDLATTLGDGKLDIMFNNAGIVDPPKPSILEYSLSDFDRVLGVNLVGAFLGTKHAARVMIPAQSGCILYTASVSSVIGGAATHAYACTKHALAGLTKNAAVELGEFGIRVNCISPYCLATPLAKKFVGLEQDKELEEVMGAHANLKGVVLKSEDVARAALYLASEDGRYVSGHNLVVDGGFTIVNTSFQRGN